MPPRKDTDIEAIATTALLRHAEALEKLAAAIERLADGISERDDASQASAPADGSASETTQTDGPESDLPEIDPPDLPLTFVKLSGAAPARSRAAPRGRLAPLTKAQIRNELANCWGAAKVADSDSIYNYISGGPGAVAAFWEILVYWPAFRQRGLQLTPNDLRFVTTVGDMVNIVNWGLHMAGRR